MHSRAGNDSFFGLTFTYIKESTSGAGYFYHDYDLFNLL